jgi:hypothetical protein
MSDQHTGSQLDLDAVKARMERTRYLDVLSDGSFIVPGDDFREINGTGKELYDEVLRLRAEVTRLDSSLRRDETRILDALREAFPYAPAGDWSKAVRALAGPSGLRPMDLRSLNTVSFRNHVHHAIAAFAEKIKADRTGWFDSNERTLVDAILSEAERRLPAIPSVVKRDLLADRIRAADGLDDWLESDEPRELVLAGDYPCVFKAGFHAALRSGAPRSAEAITRSGAAASGSEGESIA